MSTEFSKKVINNNETRYILETTSGATGSSAIATMPTDMGEVQSRTGTVPQKPRQGPLRPQTGGGSHRDKKKEQKKGQEKHKKPFFENDHEISMASNELLSIVKDAKELLMLVRRYSEMEGLEAWQQSKITKAADYLAAVLRSISGDQAFPENVQLPEAFQNDEANVMYVYDVSRGQLMQKSVRNDQERSAYAQGYRFEPEQALRAHNIIRSKFNPNIFVQKQGTKWVEVFPFGKPSDQGMSEGSNHSIEIDGKEVDSTSIEVDGVDPRDYPDFSDAYLSYAIFVDGTPLNDQQLDQLNNDYPDLIYDLAYDSLHEDVAEGNKIKISLKVNNEDSTVDVTAMLDGEEVGHVNFDDSEGELIPQDLYVDPEYRGQGIAAAMYNYTKSKGYTILRGEEQTDDAIGLWNKHRPGKDVWEQGVAEGLAPGQAAWKKEMTAKGAVSFKRDQHGGGAVDRIVAYDKDGNVVGGFNRKGVAEDFTDDVDNIYAMHPQPEKSEQEVFLITDMTEDEFSDRWTDLPDPYQQEFGYDLPLWDADDLGSYPKITVKPITFDQYVQLVGNYIKSEELAGSAMSKMKRGVAEEKIKGADGKACWKGKRYAGTKNGKDICIPVGEEETNESGLLAWAGRRKHGADYMKKASAAARKGASQEELGRLKDKYSKAEKVKEAEKKGLYYYVNKRKKAGTSRPASHPDAPSAQDWKNAAKTAKTEDTYFSELALSLAEKLDPNAPAEVWIQDFLKSNAPSVRGKPKEKRIQQALAAKYQAMNPSKKKKKK